MLMIDLQNLRAKGSGFIKVKPKKKHRSPYTNAAAILAGKTGLTRIECDSIINILFEEMFQAVKNHGTCYTPIGALVLDYDRSKYYTSIRLNLKKQYAKELNKPTGDVLREIIFE